MKSLNSLLHLFLLMKNLILIVTITLSSIAAFGQTRTIPSVDLVDIDGNTFNTLEILNEGKPILINFWATWCSPCKRELNNIAEVYDDWVDETGVVIYAVSIDDARNAPKVKPYVDGVAWDYKVLLDENADFRRQMGVVNVPHSFLVDKNGKIVHQHTSYQEGDEIELYEKIKKLANGDVLD